MEHIIMSRKERTQLIIFEKLKNKEITQREAAERLNMTERWISKKYKRYKECGAGGLVHQNRNRKSPKRWCERERNIMIELVKSEWQGFGPTFVAEKLEEIKRIKVSEETVRKEMIQAGIWQSRQKKAKHRKRRARRLMLGQMVQFDGSPHDWFEGRASACTLLVFVDDATSQLLWLEFVRSENEKDIMRATKNYINYHGIPHEFYVDFGSAFSVNTNNPERDKKTQWGRAVEELSIRVLHATSPQAKGRVERANGTLQDRLVKEMRLANISSIESANEFLQKGNFIAKHNERFAVAAAQSGDAHRPLIGYDLDAIFSSKEARILANDYTIVFNKRIFQLNRHQRTVISPKNIIIVTTNLDGIIKLFIRKTELFFKEISARPAKPQQGKIIHHQYERQKPHENSRRWVFGLAPKYNNQESRVKLASPATEAKKKRN